jgi:hypothetical protein
MVQGYEAYIRLTLQDEVSAALAVIAKEFLGLQGRVANPWDCPSSVYRLWSRQHSDSDSAICKIPSSDIVSAIRPECRMNSIMESGDTPYVLYIRISKSTFAAIRSSSKSGPE